MGGKRYCIDWNRSYMKLQNEDKTDLPDIIPRGESYTMKIRQTRRRSFREGNVANAITSMHTTYQKLIYSDCCLFLSNCCRYRGRGEGIVVVVVVVVVDRVVVWMASKESYSRDMLGFRKRMRSFGSIEYSKLYQ